MSSFLVYDKHNLEQGGILMSNLTKKSLCLRGVFGKLVLYLTLSLSICFLIGFTVYRELIDLQVAKKITNIFSIIIPFIISYFVSKTYYKRRLMITLTCFAAITLIGIIGKFLIFENEILSTSKIIIAFLSTTIAGVAASIKHMHKY